MDVLAIDGMFGLIVLLVALVGGFALAMWAAHRPLQVAPPPAPRMNKASHSTTDSQNMGTRILNWDQYQGIIASDWLNANTLPGVAVATFKDAHTAEEALKAISCIKVAADTAKLISTEIINFGVVDSGGEWAAIVHGAGLSEELQREAVRVFKNSGGTIRADTAPSKTQGKPQTKAIRGSVEFSHDVDLAAQGGIGTKEIYKATTKAAAVQFLRGKAIAKSYFYIEIETPEGWVGKDKGGMYEF